MLPSAETAKAALKFLRKAMKRYGGPEVVVTDKLRSYGAAMKVVGNADRQETGRWVNNRAENSHFAVSTTRTRHAPLSTDAMSAKVRCRPLFSPQPFQSGTPLLLTRQFQAQSNRRSY
jgi:transposase-like protein